MKTSIKLSLATLAIMALWALLNIGATERGWLQTPLATPGDSEALAAALRQQVENQAKGNVSLVLLDRGRISEQVHYSRGRPVDENSIFGVASVGKWVAAAAIMRLAETGQLDLDAPVSQYLRRWQLPPSEFDNDGVTVRRLLSHTAGITDGLGHDGFAPGIPVQPLVEHLTLAADREPNVSGRVAVGLPPGQQWQYSGGSYNLLQLLIEDITGEAFVDVMQDLVFDPLQMRHSGYVIDRDNTLLAEYFDADGGLQVYPNYTSLAATGLYSTAADMARFVRSQIPSSVLADTGPRILSDESLASMREALGSASGMPIWGAGVMLFARNGEGDFIVGHGGRSPTLNASIRVNPATGNGIVAFQTGNRQAFASRLAGHWSFWESGYPDMFTLRHTYPQALLRIAVGCAVILLLAFLLGLALWRRSAKAKATREAQEVAAVQV